MDRDEERTFMKKLKKSKKRLDTYNKNLNKIKVSTKVQNYDDDAPVDDLEDEDEAG